MEPNLVDQYTEPDGSALKSGPSAKMKHVVRNAKSFAGVFLGVLPWRFWEKYVTMSYNYMYKGYVTEVTAPNMTRPQLKHYCSTHPRTCHCADKESIKFKITPFFVCAWINILDMNIADRHRALETGTTKDKLVMETSD